MLYFVYDMKTNKRYIMLYDGKEVLYMAGGFTVRHSSLSNQNFIIYATCIFIEHIRPEAKIIYMAR